MIASIRADGRRRMVESALNRPSLRSGQWRHPLAICCSVITTPTVAKSIKAGVSHPLGGKQHGMDVCGDDRLSPERRLALQRDAHRGSAQGLVYVIGVRLNRHRHRHRHRERSVAIPWRARGLLRFARHDKLVYRKIMRL
jgi:hypothetical protein